MQKAPYPYRLLSTAVLNLDARVYFALIFIVGILALIPRLDGFDFYPGKYLWAEDGSIFLNDAQSMGLLAIFKPYRGYLLFCTRLTAFLATNLDLIYRPIITLAGWFFAYFLMIYTIASAARNLGIGWLSSVVLIGLVSLQPNYGENFFNITNSQWMLGATLMVLVLVNSEQTRRERIFKNILLIPLVLTGPFSIIVLPLIFIKLFFLKDWKNNKWSYLTVFLGSIVQLIYVVTSGRASTGAICQDPWVWLVSFLEILLFGANTFSTMAAALLFWLLIIFSFAYCINKNNGSLKELSPPFLMLAAALLLVVAGQFTSKQNPMEIVALGGGNRYSWIPYVLILITAFSVSIRFRYIHIAIISLFGFLCYANLHSASLPYLQFNSFARFSKYKEVTIPIHPQWPSYPGWHINGFPDKNANHLEVKRINLDPDSITSTELNLEVAEQGLNLQSLGNKTALIFKNSISCSNGTDVAIEITMFRNVEGWMQLSWSETKTFTEANSLRRWYPSGQIKAQFAFPNNNSGLYIRFEPMELAGAVNIKEMNVYCF